jgi:hypothetical protein
MVNKQVNAKPDSPWCRLNEIKGLIFRFLPLAFFAAVERGGRRDEVGAGANRPDAPGPYKPPTMPMIPP